MRMDTLLQHKITNRKISPTLGWADFRGFSLLFDNPGHNLSLLGENLLKIDGRFEEDEQIRLYRQLWTALAALNPHHLAGLYLFCPLPPASYHVTVWDGLNDFNKIQLHPARQAELQAFFDGFPMGFPQRNDFTAPMYASPLNCPGEWRITFAFQELCLWGNHTLVASLKPFDAASDANYQRLLQRRLDLNRAYETEFGVHMHPHYAPHISLGYFANAENARCIHHLIPQWNAVFQDSLHNSPITFESVSPYGFTDMVTFFKRP